MLYKIGTAYKRQEYFKEDLIKITEEKLEKYKAQTKLSFLEVNEFIHSFHSDFEKFATFMKND